MKEALKLALEALEKHGDAYLGHSDEYQFAITKVKEALAQPEQERCVGCEACIDTACGRDECPKGWPKAAQPEQEPVAWLIEYEACAGGMNRGSSLKKFDYVWHECSFVSEDKDAEIESIKWRNRKETPLYTTPPQRKPLTIKDIKIIATYCDEHVTDEDVIEITRRVEAAHGIKE